MRINRPTLLLLAALVGCSGGDQQAVEFDPFREITDADYADFGALRINDHVRHPVPQDRINRVFERRTSTVQQRIGGAPNSRTPESDVLYAPKAVDISADEAYAYVADAGRQQVRMFELEVGSFVRAIGVGSGDGPGEFRKISDVQVTPQGSLWVLDSQARTISLFNSAGVLDKQWGYDFQSSSFATVGNGYVMQSGLNKPNVFHFFNDEGEEQFSTGSFATHPVLNIGMSGTVVSTSRGFAWVGFYAGQIIGFDFTGNVSFYRETLYPTAAPKMRDMVMEAPEGPVAARVPLNATGNSLFVSVADSSYGQPVVDAYSLRDGSYLYSIANPDKESCSLWYVTDRHLYTMCIDEGTLTQWLRGR